MKILYLLWNNYYLTKKLHLLLEFKYKGISSRRITGKGFGETQLTNDCIDNDRHTNRVKCTKKEHQANRRTEFVIVKTK